MRRRMSKALGVLAGTGAAGTLALGMAGGASAAEPQTPSAAAVPQCVKPVTGTNVMWQYVDVTNHCKSAHSVKALISPGRDGRCMHLSPGQTLTDRFGARDQFEGLAAC